MKTATERQACTSQPEDLLGFPNDTKLDIVRAGYFDTVFVFLGEQDWVQRRSRILKEITR
jgi:hypothetical protein